MSRTSAAATEPILVINTAATFRTSRTAGRQECTSALEYREKLCLKGPERIPTVDCRTQSRYISRLRSHALPMNRRSYRDFAGKFGTDSRHGLSTGQSLRDQAQCLLGLGFSSVDVELSKVILRCQCSQKVGWQKKSRQKTCVIGMC